MILDLNKCSFAPGDTILVDANILVLVFCPLGNVRQHAANSYLNFLRRVKSQGVELRISSLILSEFANVWIRLDFEDFLDANRQYGKADFKAIYRPSKEYRDAIKDISTTYKSIRAFVDPISDDFETIGGEKLFKSNGVDVNDAHLIELAQLSKAAILTDDSDFGNAPQHVKIISYNKRLLAKK